MALLKVDEVTKLVIGKYYLVACAIGDRGGVFPIIPIKHLDKEFAPKIPHHYHYDGRFSFSFPDGTRGLMGETNSIIEAERVDRIEYRRRKCMSLICGLDRAYVYKIYWEWAIKQVGTKCKGKKCPHKGAQLTEQLDGTLYCPMHNLIICPDKSEVIGFDGYEYDYPESNRFPPASNIIEITNL